MTDWPVRIEPPNLSGSVRAKNRHDFFSQSNVLGQHVKVSLLGSQPDQYNMKMATVQHEKRIGPRKAQGNCTITSNV